VADRETYVIEAGEQQKVFHNPRDIDMQSRLSRSNSPKRSSSIEKRRTLKMRTAISTPFVRQGALSSDVAKDTIDLSAGDIQNYKVDRDYAEEAKKHIRNKTMDVDQAYETNHSKLQMNSTSQTSLLPASKCSSRLQLH